MELLVIALLVAASLGGTGIMLWALRQGRRQAAALQALAHAKGWTFDQVAATRTTSGHIEMADAAAGWRVRLVAGGGRGRASQTVWTDPSLPIPSGLAVYAAPMPEKTQAMMNTMMDRAGGLGQMLLQSVFKGLGPDARSLRAIEDDDPATLMATPGAEAAFDPLKGASELSELNQFGSNIADVPFLNRSPEGLSMRINKKLADPETLERFVRIALSLRDRLRQG